MITEGEKERLVRLARRPVGKKREDWNLRQDSLVFPKPRHQNSPCISPCLHAYNLSASSPRHKRTSGISSGPVPYPLHGTHATRNPLTRTAQRRPCWRTA